MDQPKDNENVGNSKQSADKEKDEHELQEEGKAGDVKESVVRESNSGVSAVRFQSAGPGGEPRTSKQSSHNFVKNVSLRLSGRSRPSLPRQHQQFHLFAAELEEFSSFRRGEGSQSESTRMDPKESWASTNTNSKLTATSRFGLQMLRLSALSDRQSSNKNSNHSGNHNDRYHDFTETTEPLVGVNNVNYVSNPHTTSGIRTGSFDPKDEKNDGVTLLKKAEAANERIHSRVPTLKECQENYLMNQEAIAYQERNSTLTHRIENLILDVISSFYFYITHTATMEAALFVGNAIAGAYVYCRNASYWSVKLDFSFISFAVVFPLTFLINSAFSRRDQALQNFVDFKAAFLSSALFTFTIDWGSTDPNTGEKSNVHGRRQLPRHFNEAVLRDFRQLLVLVYEYLSMPNVMNERNFVPIFKHKQESARRVHALQNDINKHLNDSMVDMALHTEQLRKFGFSASEASRLHQYHAQMLQRFEKIRVYKYYRTPHATRAFGRVYLLMLPWIMGPYFAWVFEETNRHYGYTLSLAGITFLILYGLVNTIRGLEDPFHVTLDSWLPGIDNIKLDFECSSILQSLEQYYINAEELLELT